MRYFTDKSEIHLDPKKRKKCNQCGKRKPLSEFFKKCYSKTGVSSICSKCNRENTRKFRLDNPEYDKNYEEKNKQYRLAYARNHEEKNREANIEKCRNHYEKNRESRLEYAKNYRSNRGKLKNS